MERGRKNDEKEMRGKIKTRNEERMRE